MQTATRPAGPPARKSGNGNVNVPKSAKKKKPQLKSNSAKEPAGPSPVAPPPVSGPWSNPKPAVGSAPPPGFAPSPPKPANVGFSDSHQRLLRHRALFAFRFLVGKAVELQLVASTERYAGLLDCVDPDDFSVVLKSAKRLSAGPDAKPFEDGSTVIFRRHQLAHLVADGSVDYTEAVFASAGAAGAAGFRTDTEISGQRGEHLFGRELEAASSWLDPALDTGALEDGAPNGRRHGKQGKAGWNQFEANEKLFGVVSSYDENIYTTKLDKSKISTEQSRAAERLAQEIERQSAAGNFHLQEERGQRVRGGKHANDLDEEARYSSVDRSATGDAYVPPALRNAQRQSSGGKAQAKTTKTPPESTLTPATTPVPPASELASTVAAPTAPPAAPATPKPLSFSEAVTGRSTAAASSPASAPASAPKSQSDEKKGGSPQKAASPAQVNGKDAKPAVAKSKDASPKKEANGGKEKKLDSKAEESKAVSKPSSTTSTKQSTEEAPKAAPKKALNPNAKEFKLNAGAAAFTPSFAMPPVPAVKEQVSSPYRGGSPGPIPYPHPGMGYPPPMQEEWMYDGGMGGEEGGEIGMPPYGYGVPMGPNGVPMMYPPMMPQQSMRMMGGQRGGYGGYQQAYNPRGYYSPPNGGYLAGGMPYAGGPSGVGPQPPLPREPTPSDDESPSEPAPDGVPAPPVPEAEPAVESVPATSKQASAAFTKK